MSRAPDIIESFLPRAAQLSMRSLVAWSSKNVASVAACKTLSIRQDVPLSLPKSEKSALFCLAFPIIRREWSRWPTTGIGCKKCWGADAIIELANHFDEVELDTCGSGDEHASGGIKSAVASSNRYARSSAIAAWPPHPGDYVLGNPEGTVAICTLSDRDLPVSLIAAGEWAVAIAGRCDSARGDPSGAGADASGVATSTPNGMSKESITLIVRKEVISQFR